MVRVECLNIDKYVTEYAYNINDFPYDKLRIEEIKGKKGVRYISIPATFDIETTTIKDKYKTLKEGKDCYLGFMYHWQMCVGGYVCFGRLWDELEIFLGKLCEIYQLNKYRRLVVYVHNLSYEFHFMYNIFSMTEIFATQSRKVLKCVMENCFELRCSYYLSNMNLAKFIEDTPNTIHYKGKDDLNYRELRLPSTVLNPKELGYCYNDVMGLYECINEKLKYDTLNTLPLTSTGYVRRECRNAMRKNKNNREIFLKTKLEYHQYERLKKSFRGGNTASNRYRVNKIYNNVYSYDIASSYPYVMMSEKYPMGKFIDIDEIEIDEAEEYNNKYATVGKYTFSNICINTDIAVPIPYLAVSKCEKISNITNYNGRILRGDYIEIFLTNIDYEIIKKQYNWDECYVDDFMYASTDYLPQELRDCIIKYYTDKTLLKNVVGKEYEYSKSKNLLNSIYGMTVTDINRGEITFNNGEWSETDAEQNLDEYYNNKNSFLPYQWGVYVTAYARRNLQRVIDILGYDMIYCDTDSVKYVGNYDDEIECINNDIIEKNKQNNIIHYVEKNGKRIYMGLWDKEIFTDKHKNKYECYSEFITLGAKKYAYTLNGECHVTVSGLSKIKGGEELQKKGGITKFRLDEIFFDSGRTVAYYNNDEPHYILVENEPVKVGANVAIVDTTYTLGITDTMLSIIETIENL